MTNSIPKKEANKTKQKKTLAVKVLAKVKGGGPKKDPIYTAMAMQLATYSLARYPDRDSARARMAATLDYLEEKVRGAKAWMGPALKLVVLPEYLLTSFPEGEQVPQWADKAALDMNGPEYDKFGEIAQSNGIYLAGNAYETDPHFPEYYFQTSFIVAPSGNVILRYRRLNSMFSPSPHDVWDKYIDIYGLDAVFPVADTEIGRLAPIASEEILYPEVARCFAMRGAEVFTHSSSEFASPIQTRKDAAKICRAVENIAYVVSANTGGIRDTDMPPDSSNGGSRIIDFRGKLLRLSGTGDNSGASAEIDLSALRRERRKTGLNNTLIRQRFEAYAGSYDSHSFQPANSLLKKDGSLRSPQRKHFVDTQKAVISRLSKKGII
ncbi:MAG: nitrilase-related carbon-nitrogen hydrolase [Rhodospirillaceae bacterium]|nr:nitrilase-related carbon-nitrogen hydrolase [Rhodospirillaceae bacterium]